MPERFDCYQPPSNYRSIRCIDMHTGGEPLRVITHGFPALAGSSQLARRSDCQQHWDHLRTALMFEPRGHADMYGALITPPERETSHFGVLFLHNEGYSTMCGHAILALARLAVACELVAANETVRIDTPAGLVCAQSDIHGQASFFNVPSFVDRLSIPLQHPTAGKLYVDIAYGGAYYAFIDAASVGIQLVPENAARLSAMGTQIKSLAAREIQLEHPDNPALAFLYGVIFTDRSPQPGVHSRHVCIFADGELDRSPTGTGVSARLALLHHRKEIAQGQQITIDSILGSTFDAAIEHCQQRQEQHEITVRIAGKAHITGRHEFLIDPDDPLATGFVIR